MSIISKLKAYLKATGDGHLYDVSPPKPPTLEQILAEGPVVMGIYSKEELANYHKWLTDHHACRYKYAGAIGGAESYKFTPTSLGTATSIWCAHCETWTNITYYGDW